MVMVDMATVTAAMVGTAVTAAMEVMATATEVSGSMS